MSRLIGLLRERWFQLTLLGVLVVGASLRLYKINWDGGSLAHPDERSTVAFYAPTIRLPDDISTALDPRKSPLNPFWDINASRRRSYTYGHFPLYLLVITVNLIHRLAPLAERLGASPETVEWLRALKSIQGFAFVGRFLMALVDTATVYLVYLIASRLYNRKAGLLAAAFSAFTVTQIQLAHFFAVDPISATFTLLALYGAILMLEVGTTGAALLTGIGAGLAIASKFSALPILIAPAVAALILLRRRSDFALADAIRLVSIAFLAALLSFAFTSPFVLIDFINFVQAVIIEQGAMVKGISDLPFTRQYRGTIPYIYHIVQQLRWGMGWPLGLVAFAGVGWVLVKAILRRASSGELILLSWIVPYFGVTGLFLAKFMRYMIPVVPLFVLMGAGMLVGERRGERGIRHALTVIALGGAIFWSLAFVNGVYRTEHTWILASRWIYDNLPDGSVIGSEHWDDDLPLDLPEPGKSKGARKYRLVELPMYEEDTEEKYNLIRSRLRECDYIVLASNRLYRSIPRLPQRYPMTTKYYELLFSGQLGFEKVAEFTTYPKLGPFVFCDDDADESFTVYDHPKPIVFKKVRELSDEEWEELLGGSWVGAIPGYVGKPTLLSRLFKRGPSPPSQPKPEEGKTLLLSEPVDELPIVNDFRWNSIANRYHIFAIFFFWLVVELIGFAAWPFAFVVFRSLSDRGYILAKSLGLLAISYVVWLASSIRLLKNTLSTAILALSLLSLLSLHLFRRNKGEMTAFWKSRKRLVLFNEAFFSLAFLAFVVIRLFNPDLWQPWFGGEKMMEFAFLNAILKSAHFPPYDPYFAGGYLNYYYYGQFIVAVLIKLTGIMPSVAFNLAVPTLFALTVGNAFCVGYNLAGGDRRGAMAVGLLSSFFVAIIGNLASMVQIVVRLGEVGGSDFRSNIPLLEGLVKALPGLAKVMLGRASIPGFDYWWPSRVIPKTINEFPFWSFLFADLHPHMIGMPFTILVVALAFEIARGKRRVTSLFWAVIPLSLGAVTVINTWDFPTYFFIIACALLIKRLTSPLSSLLPSLLSLLSSLLLYWPFFAHYKALFVGIGFVKERTELGPFLAIWGFFFFVLTTFLLVELMRQRSRLGILRFLRLILGRWDELPRLFELYNALVHKPESGYILALRALSLLSILVAVLILLKAWVIALLLPFTALAALLLLRREASREELFTYLLVFTGLLILLGCEVFYLKDFLSGGEWRRMNTIFKFHIQAWVLLGLAMGSILPRLLNHVMGWRSAKLRVGWIAIFAFLLLSSSLFLPLGVPARVKDRFPGERPPIGTLDGMAYMTVGSYTWPEDNRIELKYDYEAIKWLLENVKGTPVIAEAVLPYYREGGLRVSSYTGLPTLLGAHQSEQRYGWQVGERDKEAREFFNTADIERALQIIRGIRISYIYIGQLERTVYDPAGLGKFERMVEEGYLEVVFENERVRIYRVI